MTNTVQKIETAALKRMDQINPANMNQMQFAHQVWSVTTREALTVEELEHPDTWALAANKLRLFDRVEVMAANGSQLSLGIVTFAKGTQIKVQIYGHYPLHEQKHNEIEYEGFIVKWGGLDRNWIIVEKDSGEVMKENLPTDRAGIKYLEDHYKSLNVKPE